MKKFHGFLFILAILALGVVSWAAEKAFTPKKLVVGVAPGPYGDLFKKAVQPELEKKGYKVEIKEFSDYVQPDLALAGNDIDLNVFQHAVYLEKFAKDKGLKIAPVISVPTAGLGIFSKKIKSLEEIKEGAEVTIANDPTNLARALRFLASLNLITFKADIDPVKASEKDIESNPKKLKITPVEAAQIPRTVESVDFAVVNGNYAIASGLKLSEALALETLEEKYKIVVTVRTEDLEKPFTQDIKDAVESETFRDAVEEPKNNFKEFQKPRWYLKKWKLEK